MSERPPHNPGLKSFQELDLDLADSKEKKGQASLEEVAESLGALNDAIEGQDFYSAQNLAESMRKLLSQEIVAAMAAESEDEESKADEETLKDLRKGLQEAVSKLPKPEKEGELQDVREIEQALEDIAGRGLSLDDKRSLGGKVEGVLAKGLVFNGETLISKKKLNALTRRMTGLRNVVKKAVEDAEKKGNRAKTDPSSGKPAKNESDKKKALNPYEGMPMVQGETAEARLAREEKYLKMPGADRPSFKGPDFGGDEKKYLKKARKVGAGQGSDAVDQVPMPVIEQSDRSMEISPLSSPEGAETLASMGYKTPRKIKNENRGIGVERPIGLQPENDPAMNEALEAAGFRNIAKEEKQKQEEERQKQEEEQRNKKIEREIELEREREKERVRQIEQREKAETEERISVFLTPYSKGAEGYASVQEALDDDGFVSYLQIMDGQRENTENMDAVEAIGKGGEAIIAERAEKYAQARFVAEEITSIHNEDIAEKIGSGFKLPKAAENEVQAYVGELLFSYRGAAELKQLHDSIKLFAELPENIKAAEENIQSEIEAHKKKMGAGADADINSVRENLQKEIEKREKHISYADKMGQKPKSKAGPARQAGIQDGRAGEREEKFGYFGKLKKINELIEDGYLTKKEAAGESKIFGKTFGWGIIGKSLFMTATIKRAAERIRHERNQHRHALEQLDEKERYEIQTRQDYELLRKNLLVHLKPSREIRRLFNEDLANQIRNKIEEVSGVEGDPKKLGTEKMEDLDRQQELLKKIKRSKEEERKRVRGIGYTNPTAPGDAFARSQNNKEISGLLDDDSIDEIQSQIDESFKVTLHRKIARMIDKEATHTSKGYANFEGELIKIARDPFNGDTTYGSRQSKEARDMIAQILKDKRDKIKAEHEAGKKKGKEEKGYQKTPVDLRIVRISQILSKLESIK